MGLLLNACSVGDDRSTETRPTATAPGPNGPVGSTRTLPRLRARVDPVNGGRIVDDHNREVVLRGVNVNALVDYWKGSNRFPTVFPLAEDDPATMAGLGFNAVRLLLSWSKVEPEPGRYDESYLRRASAVVDRLSKVGIYSIIDLHQDAWGPTLAAPEGTICPAGSSPALGWDGAPGWATLDRGAARCAPGGTRELSAAVRAAWMSFFADGAGPGGVGVQSRYVSMLGHVAGFFSGADAVAGLDVMNEPNAFGDDEQARLSAFYAKALSRIRAAEADAGGGRHLVLFEPSALWSTLGKGAPPNFAHDDDIVYAPHIYTGGFTNGPITADAFAPAIEEAKAWGGVPVLTGEWGADPDRAADPSDGYFDEHLDLQDEFGVSSTLWTWRESCGDPHKIGSLRAGDVPTVWGLFEVDCRTNAVAGVRRPLADALRRGFVRFAPGRLRSHTWARATKELRAAGEGASPGVELVAWYPCRSGTTPMASAGGGLRDVRSTSGSAGCIVSATTTGRSWSLRVSPG